MGASFNTITYNSEDKEQIKKTWKAEVEESLYQDGHSYSGCIGMLGVAINFVSYKAESIDDAEEYIADHQEKWSMAMGVHAPSQKAYVIGGWCSE